MKPIKRKIIIGYARSGDVNTHVDAKHYGSQRFWLWDAIKFYTYLREKNILELPKITKTPQLWKSAGIKYVKVKVTVSLTKETD